MNILTGFSDLDQLTGGFCNNDSIGMENIQEITIPRVGGHIHYFSSELLNIYEAYRRVSEGSTQYALAIKIDSYNILLYHSSYKCFNCEQIFTLPCSTNNDFMDFTIQLSLPEFETVGESFRFRPIPDFGRIRCSFCKHFAPIAAPNLKTKYTLTTNTYYCSIAQQIDTVDKYYELPISFADREDCIYPLYAEIVFNHESRRTKFTIRNNVKVPVYDNDITETISPLEDFSISKCICADTKLRTELIAAFESINKGKLPFNTEELELETFILINRFPGYPRLFYDSIPFEKTGRRLHKTFENTANHIESGFNIGMVYKNLGLPEKKQFKKAIMENPALLFYATELMNLPIKNYDVLLKIIKSSKVFKLLAYLHSLPGLYLFLERLVNEKGDIVAWKFIEKANMEDLPCIAGLCMISPESELDRIIRNYHEHTPYYELSKPEFNLPVPQQHKLVIPDENINGYFFVALRNTVAYEKAGRKLSNCIGSYGYGDSYDDSRIFCIKHNGTYIGAVKVYKDKVREASLHNNKPIKENVDVYNAYLLWMEKNSLS